MYGYVSPGYNYESLTPESDRPTTTSRYYLCSVFSILKHAFKSVHCLNSYNSASTVTTSDTQEGGYVLHSGVSKTEFFLKRNYLHTVIRKFLLSTKQIFLRFRNMFLYIKFTALLAKLYTINL